MPKPQTKCQCAEDCAALTRSSFAPGHDARMVGRLTRAVKYALVTLDEAAAEMNKAGGSPALQAKLLNSVRNNVKVRFEWVNETALVDLSWQICIQYVGGRSTTTWDHRGNEVIVPLDPWVVSWRTSGREIGATKLHQEAIDLATKMMLKAEGGYHMVAYQEAMDRATIRAIESGEAW